MTLNFADRVLETTTTTGTGTYTVAGPTTGFISFATAGLNGKKVPYVVDDGLNWECGIGTYTTGSPNTLARNTILSSSNSNAAVNWGVGTRNVRLAPLSNLVAQRDENLNFLEGFGAGGGTANLQTLTLSPSPLAYSDGMEISWFPTVTNTGAMTINVNSLGAKSIKFLGADPLAGMVASGSYARAIYKAASGWFELIITPYGVPAGGVTNPSFSTTTAKLFRAKAPPQLTYNATDRIDIAGSVSFVTDGGVAITSTALTKLITSTWAAGTGVGGLDTGTKANSTQYAIWAIYNPTSGLVDYLYSLSATAPTMPGGYTDKRRIGWIRTDASGNIMQFQQNGDFFLYKTPPAIAPTLGARTLTTLPAPPSTEVKFRLDGSHTAATLILLQTTYETTASPSGANGTTPGTSLYCPANVHAAGEFQLLTDSSAQIAITCSLVMTTAVLAVIGWYDRRGRDD